MSMYGDGFSQMAPWRKLATVALTLIAIVVLVLAITGVFHTATLILVLAIVTLSFLIGPRSPFFR
jgi:hypothetical protein